MDSSDSKRTRLLTSLALAVITLAVYARVAGFDFVNYDDPDYVTGNKMVQGGLTLRGIGWAFTHCYASNWHPLTWISHMLDYQLFGAWAGGHHLVNVVLHTANAIILFLFLCRLTGAQWRSAMVAALFASHPLHVESVAWISERKDVLSTFFGVLTLFAYVRYVQELKIQGAKSKAWYASALVFFAMGLMAKPMLVTFPFLMLLLDFWPLARVENQGWRSIFTPRFAKLVLEKWPWVFLAAVSSAITFYAQKTGGAVLSADSFPVTERVTNAIGSYLEYVVKAFWPVGLAVFYPLQQHRSLLVIAIGILFLLLGSAVFVLTSKRYPFLLVGWLWLLGTLVPVIGLVQVGNQAMADRYTYIPLTGLFIATVWGAYELLLRTKAPALFASITGAVVLALFTMATVFQLQYWRNSLTLFTHTLAVTRDNALAHNDLGTALVATGKREDAIAQYEEAVRIDPANAEYQNNLATALARAGQPEAAIEHYRAATRLAPQFAEAFSNLGAMFLGEHRLDDAITYLSRAVQIEPDNGDARNNLANALLAAGQMNEALAQYQEALRLDPTNATFHFNAGLALVKARKTDDAVGQFTEAVRLNPASAESHYELGRQLFIARQFQPALQLLSEAVKLKADYASAEFYLGLTCLELHDMESGLNHLAAAERLRPDWMDPLNAHAWVLATSVDDKVRNGAEAVRLAQRAVNMTSARNPVALNTLAAAYAETGRFQEAAATANLAIEAATQSGQNNIIPKIQKTLDACNSQHPLREKDFDSN